MSTYRATVDWRCEGDFASRRYSRVHQISFDGGLSVPGTAGPANVNPRYSMEGAMDPEQAFVASLSACHMLWFLDIAAQAGYVIESYRDEALGEMGHNEAGKEVVTRVVLRPLVAFGGTKVPDDEALRHLHHEAHESCYLANSVKTMIEVEGSWTHSERGA